MSGDLWPAHQPTAALADNRVFHTQHGSQVARTNEWAGKVLRLLQAGNSANALAQIKVAPSVKDLRALQASLAAAPLSGRWPDVEIAVRDAIDALSAPRLHRSP